MGKELELERLPEIIKRIRLNTGKTQIQVAEDLHCTPGYVSNVENGRTAISIRIVSYYAKISGLTIDDILKGRLDSINKQKGSRINEMLSLMSVDDKERLLATIQLWRR
uniref:helix-turn-helix domain-containing protein n=1 Tax=Eubacterium cellulosolvens TaxID=29322 RepID=UPI00138AF7FC|nr:helix-turn-helix transcriptional regulator [[Eubacterium] cellulosolvens]